MIKLFRQPWTFWFEWGITALLIIGAVLTSLNIYPLNIWFLFLSNLGWAIQAIMWKKYSLLTVQTVITIIYLPPLIKSFL
jgi:hypothetical protein